MLFQMATAALRNLFMKPACYMYPGKLREPFKDTRGKLTIEIEKCIFCNICARKCPSQAIVVTKAKVAKPTELAGGNPGLKQSLSAEQNSWQLDRLRCVSCGSCVEHCPKSCLFLDHTAYQASVSEKTIEIH